MFVLGGSVIARSPSPDKEMHAMWYIRQGGHYLAMKKEQSADIHYSVKGAGELGAKRKQPVTKVTYYVSPCT